MRFWVKWQLQHWSGDPLFATVTGKLSTHVPSQRCPTVRRKLAPSGRRWGRTPGRCASREVCSTCAAPALHLAWVHLSLPLPCHWWWSWLGPTGPLYRWGKVGVRRASDSPGFSPPGCKLKAKDLRGTNVLMGIILDQPQMPVASQSIFAAMTNLKSSQILQLDLPLETYVVVEVTFLPAYQSRQTKANTPYSRNFKYVWPESGHQHMRGGHNIMKAWITCKMHNSPAKSTIFVKIKMLEL